MSLFRPSELHLFLEQVGVKAKKALSQNFLVDGNIIQKILKLANVEPGDLIIEIGPGPGALTQALLRKGAKVIAIEKDKTFANALFRLQTNDNRLVIFEEDFLEFPLQEILAKELEPGKLAKVVANLPYHLTSPIIGSLAPLHHQISTLTLMVQKEVGVRMTAKKGGPDYSSFTVFLQYYSDLSYGFTVEPTCFYPRPKVQSAVVKLFLKEPPQIPEPKDFFLMVRTAFGQRRKMLRSSLREIYDVNAIQEALEHLKVNPLARPQELSLSEFIQLFTHLKASV